MTPTFSDKIKQLPKPVQVAFWGKKTISYSQANEWHTCPLMAKFGRIDKIPTPFVPAMAHGNIFDAFVEGESPDTTNISEELVKRIAERAVKYESSLILPDGVRRSLQFPVYAPLADGWYCFGFMDELWLNADGTINRIEDRKFSGKPWNDSRVKYNHKQAQVYMWLLRQMGYAIPKQFWFRVMNLATDELQLFPYKPMQKSIAGVEAWLNEAIQIKVAIQEGRTAQHKAGHHCKHICSFNRNCDEVNWNKKLTPP